MALYSDERKDAVLKKLLPPLSMAVAEVARLEGISPQTLYNWRSKIKATGRPVPGKTSSTEQWSAEAKLAVIIETAVLSESELSEYCRKKGLYIEQIKVWKTDCLAGFQISKEQQRSTKLQTKLDKAEIRDLKKDLRRKEKALAETAALLVLRKKLHAFWEEDNGEI